LEKRSQPSVRISWGTGRVSFKKHLPFIQQQIESGSPLTAVYERIKESLAGMSYNAFTYHARKHFASAVVQRVNGCKKARKYGDVRCGVDASQHSRHKFGYK
jgi:hypothetical protein